MNTKDLKLNKGETIVYIKAVDGKAIFYAKHYRYYRLMAKSNIDMPKITVCISAKNFKDMVKRMELVKPEKFILDDCRLYINDSDNKNNMFVVNLDELPDFVSSFSETALIKSDFLKKIKNTRDCVSDDEHRAFIQVYHFEDDNCVATDGRVLSCVKGTTQKLLTLCDGNIFAEVFDCFNGKSSITVSKVKFNGEDYLKLTDGITEVYTPVDPNVQFPNWKKIVPEVTSDYKSGIFNNLKGFKKLLPSLKSYNYAIDIDDGVCKTLDKIELCKVDDVLNGYRVKADYLTRVAELFGDSSKCIYKTNCNDKAIIFGDLSADFMLVMPNSK
jgi:hypothetical protein